MNIYNVPVKGEPEYGVSTKVPARFEGGLGYYGIGLGIDQESAIFISQELNGQPKFPCSIVYFRRDDAVEARCTDQGYTFLEFHGQVTGVDDVESASYEDHEWWIKSSRAVGGVEKSYDFPPHVVDVASVQSTVRKEHVDGSLVLRDSPGIPTPPCSRCTSCCPPTWSGPGRSVGRSRCGAARPPRVLALRRHDRRLPLARVQGRPPSSRTDGRPSADPVARFPAVTVAAERLLVTMWQAVNGEPDDPPRVEFTGHEVVRSASAVTDFAAAAVATAAFALARLIDAAAVAPLPGVSVDRSLASAWFGLSLRPEGWQLTPLGLHCRRLRGERRMDSPPHECCTPPCCGAPCARHCGGP